MLFGPFEHVPAYPLVFPLFYGAAVIFALVMARHLRVFAVAGPSTVSGKIPARLWGVVEYALPARIGEMAGADRGWGVAVSDEIVLEALQ